MWEKALKFYLYINSLLTICKSDHCVCTDSKCKPGFLCTLTPQIHYIYIFTKTPFHFSIDFCRYLVKSRGEVQTFAHKCLCIFWHKCFSIYFILIGCLLGISAFLWHTVLRLFSLKLLPLTHTILQYYSFYCEHCTMVHVFFLMYFKLSSLWYLSLYSLDYQFVQCTQFSIILSWSNPYTWDEKSVNHTEINKKTDDWLCRIYGCDLMS